MVAKFSCRSAGTPGSCCAFLKKCHYQPLLLHCWPSLQWNFDKINEQVCLTAEANSIFSILSGCFPELLLPRLLSNSACWRCSTASPSFFGLVWLSQADRAQVLFPFSQDSWDDGEDLIPSGSRFEILELSNGFLCLRAGWTSDFVLLANIIRLEALLRRFVKKIF